MPRMEARKERRENLFLLAEMRVGTDSTVHPIKVRNLSPSGMMGEGPVHVMRGSRISMDFDQIGPVTGTVAWVQDDRFGVAFDEAIDWRLLPGADGSDPN